MSKQAPPYQIVKFSDLPSVACPCGSAKRAFADLPDAPASVHVTEISLDAKRHYHREHTEIYYILTCQEEARMELDDEIIPLQPGMAVYIPPGVRHRALGTMTILNLVTPPFDPEDEYFDEADSAS
ncbi:Cupin domain-containing protein [Planctomycetales bacterium 10988]|nr:Cupin domain-containing protein [Planctomycetales bacterium 10988]